MNWNMFATAQSARGAYERFESFTTTGFLKRLHGRLLDRIDLDGPYCPAISRKLDAVMVLLESS